MGPGRSAAACAKVSGRLVAREEPAEAAPSQCSVKLSIYRKTERLSCRALFWGVDVEVVQRRMAGKLQKLRDFSETQPPSDAAEPELPAVNSKEKAVGLRSGIMS